MFQIVITSTTLRPSIIDIAINYRWLQMMIIWETSPSESTLVDPRQNNSLRVLELLSQKVGSLKALPFSLWKAPKKDYLGLGHKLCFNFSDTFPMQRLSDLWPLMIDEWNQQKMTTLLYSLTYWTIVKNFNVEQFPDQFFRRMSLLSSKVQCWVQ